MKETRTLLAALGVVLLLLLCSCGAATRALIHRDDQKKVFPWPEGQQSVSVRVKPLSGKVKMFPFSGDWQNLEVTPETTFYITEETGGEFAYTPNRSPIRRLAPVEKIQIRWPPAAPAAAAPAPEQPAEHKPAAEKPAAESGK